MPTAHLNAPPSALRITLRDFSDRPIHKATAHSVESSEVSRCAAQIARFPMSSFTGVDIRKPERAAVQFIDVSRS